MSELTPILGWSWVSVEELSALYWYHVPVASVLAETAITTTLAYVGGMKATPDANHRWLTWSKSTRGSEKLYPVGTLKNRLRSNRFSR